MRHGLIGVTLGVFGLFATTAAAQTLHGPVSIKVHNHPQLSVYTDLSQFPIPSIQGHWDNPANHDDMTNVGMDHIHIDPQCPYLGEFKTGDVVTCGFLITLRDCDCYLDQFNAGLQNAWVSDVVWDDTGSSAWPAPVGDPNPMRLPPPAGIKTWHGKFSFAMPANYIKYDDISITTRGRFSDGSVMVLETLVPIWSTNVSDDPAALGSDTPLVRATVRMSSAANPDITYGYTSVESPDLLPLLPVPDTGTPYSMRFSTYGYGGVADIAGSVATTISAHDFDFHHGIVGSDAWVIQESGGVDVINQPLTFDQEGAHKYGVIRMVMNRGDMHAALFTYVVTTAPDGLSMGTPPAPDPMPMPMPPPMTMPPPVPTTLSCVGSVTGTSTDGGMTVMPTSAIVWSCK